MSQWCIACVGGMASDNYYQSNLLPPEGCECDDVYKRSAHGPMAGYVKANQVYFGRGSIQLSWNYNDIRASVVLVFTRRGTIRTIKLRVWRNECRETENMGD